MKFVGIAVVLVVALSSGQALADPGEAGQLAVAAERLTGFTYTTSSSEDDYGKRTTTVSNFHLLSNPLSGFATAYSVPRVGVDYFVAPGVSLGGSLSYARIGVGYKEEPTGGPSTDYDSTLNLWSVSPRVGYAHMFSSGVGIWPRAGVTYIRTSTSYNEDDSESSGSALALTVEAPLLLAPAPNVAITLGPTIDFGLSTSSEEKDENGMVIDSNGTDNPPHEFGVQAGLTVFF